MTTNSLPTDYQSFIHLSRYSRWVDSLKRRETWGETVSRYVENVIKPVLKDDPVVSEIEQAILGLEVMPSMRGLMTAGKALNRDNTCLFNCSYLTVDHVRSFDEAMFILLCGTGVGFSVERQYVSKLPDVPEVFQDTDSVIDVKDSKEGWANAFRELIGLLYSGVVPKWDVSKVRPAGARLKTFGGRASGPAPLVELFNFAIATFKKAAGRKLSSIECHDLMCKIGEVVVVGGVRRSAMISLSNLSDDRMRHAKSGNWWETNPQRALANNSVSYTEKPDMETFLREWTALVESKSGERGIFNRVASKKQALKNGRRETDGWEYGTNPCCVSGETLILTKEGYKRIDSVVGTKQTIWNGESWADVEPYEAGEGDLVRVTLTDGSYLDCTWNHRWVVEGEFVETENLRVGNKLSKFDMPVVLDGEEYHVDPYSQGFYSGDGNKGLDYSYLYRTKYMCEPRLIGSTKNDSYLNNRKIWKHGAMLDSAFVPINGSLKYKIEWLAGLLDSDGTVTRDENGNGFQITSINHAFLSNLKLMLTTLGVRAKICKGDNSGYKSMPDGNGGYKYYYCQATYRILIGNTDAYHLVNIGLNTSRLQHNGNAPQRDARRFVRVKSIEPLDRYEMSYCFTEPKTSRGTFNGIVTGNSEIILRPQQFCNLSEPVIRATDTFETIKRKVRLATIIGTVQSTYTKFPYLRKIWEKNTNEERLLGVSLTGIMDNPDLLDMDLNELKQVAIEANKEYADKLGIPVSAAITCVKPSGTVSQLVDSASGIHARHSPFYIRTVRGDNKDPLTQFMIDSGIPSEPCVMKPETTTVFSFPQRSPDGAVTRNDMSAIEQLEVWLKLQRDWCEHKPSITVSVRDHEWMEVGAFVYKYFDEMSGVSFLPHSDHTYQQAPYQDCTEDEYNEMLVKMPTRIDWTKLGEYEFDDNTSGSQTLSCTAGACEIVDI